MTTLTTKMEIIEIDSADFKALELNLDEGKRVGEYEKAGKSRTVMVVSEFVVVNIEESPDRVGLLQANSATEAVQYASKIIKRANRNLHSSHTRITLSR